MSINYESEQLHSISIGAEFCSTGFSRLGLLDQDQPTLDQFHAFCVGMFNIAQGFELIFRSILIAANRETNAKGHHPIQGFFDAICDEFPSFANQLDEVGLSRDKCATSMITLEKAHVGSRYFGLGKAQKSLDVRGMENCRKFYLLLGITFLGNTLGFNEFKLKNMPIAKPKP